jgi:hypothetical protein
MNARGSTSHAELCWPGAVGLHSWDESPRLGRTAGSAVAPCRLDALT